MSSSSKQVEVTPKTPTTSTSPSEIDGHPEENSENSHSYNTRKRTIKKLELEENPASETIEIKNEPTSPSILSPLTTLAIPSVQDEEQPGPSNAKIPLKSSAFTSAEIMMTNDKMLISALQSHDQIMENMIIENKRMSQKFQLDAFNKVEEISKLKQGFEECVKKMQKKILDHKNEIERLELEVKEKEDIFDTCLEKNEGLKKKISGIRSDKNKLNKSLAEKEKCIEELKDQLAETKSESDRKITEIKSELDVQLELNVENETKLRTISQELNRRNSQIQDIKKFYENFTAQDTNSCTNMDNSRIN